MLMFPSMNSFKSYIRTSLSCLAVVGLSACSVNCEDTGAMPEVEVSGGRLPKANVETAEVDVRTKKKQIEVPEVDVRTEKKTIEVPTVDVDMPNDADD